jgi:hypothetical protein
MKVTPRPPDETSNPGLGSKGNLDGFFGIEIIVGLLILRGSKR